MSTSLNTIKARARDRGGARSELQEGIAFVAALRAELPEVAEYLLHIPNGGKRSVIEARNLKASGVRAGVPDYFLAMPTKGHNGLWLELKRSKGGRLSGEQSKWLERLTDQGYRCVVCRGAGEAMDAVREYLGEEERQWNQSNKAGECLSIFTKS